MVENLEKFVVSAMTSDPALNALIEGRVYADVLLVKDRPSLSFAIISAVYDFALNGDTDAINALVQITVHADSVSSRAAVSKAVYNRINSAQGGTFAGLRVRAARMEGASDAYDPDVEQTRHRARIIEARFKLEVA